MGNSDGRMEGFFVGGDLLLTEDGKALIWEDDLGRKTGSVFLGWGFRLTSLMCLSVSHLVGYL